MEMKRLGGGGGRVFVGVKGRHGARRGGKREGWAKKHEQLTDPKVQDGHERLYYSLQALDAVVEALNEAYAVVNINDGLVNAPDSIDNAVDGALDAVQFVVGGAKSVCNIILAENCLTCSRAHEIDRRHWRNDMLRGGKARWGKSHEVSTVLRG